MAKQERQKPIVTPAGRLKFPKVHEPDMSEYSTKKVPEGIFKAPLVFEPDDAAWQAFGDKVQAFYDENVKAAKQEKKKVYPQTHPWFKADTEKDEDDNKVETGKLFIEAKLPAMTKGNPAKGIKPRAQKPVIVDAQKNPISSDTPIWGGSTAKASVLLNFYNEAGTGSGVSFRLVGVQILNLVSGGGFNADSAGFGEEEGYVAESATAKNDDSADDDEGDGESKPF